MLTGERMTFGNIHSYIQVIHSLCEIVQEFERYSGVKSLETKRLTEKNRLNRPTFSMLSYLIFPFQLGALILSVLHHKSLPILYTTSVCIVNVFFFFNIPIGFRTCICLIHTNNM